MIVLDTNVVSELMRPVPDPAVTRYFDRHEESALHVTAITAAELWRGAAFLPEGSRRTAFHSVIEQILMIGLGGRVLPFDVSAARAYAEIAASRRRMGRPMGMADAQIAAIARVHGAALATRNVRDFDACGVTVVNPWDESVTE